jgi:hypothetical protein
MITLSPHGVMRPVAQMSLQAGTYNMSYSTHSYDPNSDTGPFEV